MADILIRGMEMPKENDTPILAWICSDGNVVFFQNPTKFLRGETTGTAYGGKAKAIQLPAWHGRLKDSAGIIGKIKETYCGACLCPPTSFNCQLCKITKVLEIIENEPTIVPAGGGTDNV